MINKEKDCLSLPFDVEIDSKIINENKVNTYNNVDILTQENLLDEMMKHLGLLNKTKRVEELLGLVNKAFIAMK